MPHPSGWSRRLPKPPLGCGSLLDAGVDELAISEKSSRRRGRMSVTWGWRDFSRLRGRLREPPSLPGEEEHRGKVHL